MSTQPRRAVFDCNVYLQAMLSSRGAANGCWQKAVRGEVTVYVTSFVLTEIRRLPQHRSLGRFSQFTQERVERFIEELLDVAVVAADPTPVFSYARDPDDAHYINLAIATGAMLVVSNDRDLLDLMSTANMDGETLRKLCPSLRILARMPGRTPRGTQPAYLWVHAGPPTPGPRRPERRRD